MNALDPQKMTLACRPKIIFLNQLFAITQFQDLFVKDHSRFAGGSLQSEQITTGSVHGPIIIAGSAVACDRHPGGHCAKGLQKYRCRWRRHLFFIPTSQCPCRSDRHHQYCPWTLRGCTCRWATRLMESQRRVLEESIDRRERNNPSADQGVAQGAAASNTPNRQSITDALAEQLQRSRSTSRDTRPAGAGGNSSRSRSSR